MIIANDVSDTTIGFNSDENAVTVIDKTSEIVIEKLPKRALAAALVQHIAQKIH